MKGRQSHRVRRKSWIHRIPRHVSDLPLCEQNPVLRPRTGERIYPDFQASCLKICVIVSLEFLSSRVKGLWRDITLPKYI